MTYQTMEVRPIAGALGAEIYGANLKDRDDSPMWLELRQAFLEYHVIAVRVVVSVSCIEGDVSNVAGGPQFSKM